VRGGFRYPKSRMTSRAFCAKAGSEEIVITRNDKPAGVLIGFSSEDDWLDCQLENDPRLLNRIEQRAKAYGRGAASGLKMSRENAKTARIVER
jgi:hypothetical protein